MRPLYLKINQFRNQRNDDKVNNIVVSDNIKIENMIYEIRGKQVMLDSDLAMLYGCKNGTKSLNLAVKRHTSAGSLRKRTPKYGQGNPYRRKLNIPA